MSIPETSQARGSDMPPPPLPRSAMCDASGSSATAQDRRSKHVSIDLSRHPTYTVPTTSKRAARMRSTSGEGSPRPRLGSWAFKYTPSSTMGAAPQAGVLKDMEAQAADHENPQQPGRALSAGGDKDKVAVKDPPRRDMPTLQEIGPNDTKTRTSGRDLSISVPVRSPNDVSSPKFPASSLTAPTLSPSRQVTTPVSHHNAPIQDSYPTPSSTLSERRGSAFSTDTDPLLRMVAAQERRVLELKEQLKNEEDQLAKLKVQWASQEAKRKRSELRRSEQMRPLGSPRGKSPPRDPSRHSQDSAETEGSADTARPVRTKFEGGRHLRTLTLTTPVVGGGSAPEPVKTQEPPVEAPRRSSKERNVPTPSGTNRPSGAVPTSLMGDLRENLWTFIEDLKQATVGEEATVSPGKPRPGDPEQQQQQQPASPSIRPRPDTPDKRASMPPLRPKPAPAAASSTPRPPPQPMRLAPPASVDVGPETEDDPSDWGSWESPAPALAPAKGSPPTSAEGFSGSEAAWSSPRTSTSSSMAAITSGERELGGEVDPGKWRPNSVISTFSPRELGKRASTFMADWERSLASPTGGVADGLGKGGKVD